MAISLFASCICCVLKKRNCEPPPLDEVDDWEAIWLNIYRDPFILRTFAAELQQFLWSGSDLKKKKIDQLANCKNLKEFNSLLSEMTDEKGILFREHLSKKCSYSLIKVSLDFYLSQSGKMKRVINQAALLKYQIESARFAPLSSLHFGSLLRIGMDQVAQSYFHPHSSYPSVSIWINGRQFDVGDPPLPVFEYYKRMIEALYFVTSKEKIDGSIYAGNLIEKCPFERGPIASLLSLMLKAGSFSSFGYADSALRAQIFKPLPGYSIKFPNPPDSPTCEFFAAENLDFTTIRTGVYDLCKNQKKIGEFVVKWTVNVTEGNLSSWITIPMIDVFDVQNDPHENIFKMFDLTKKIL